MLLPSRRQLLIWGTVVVLLLAVFLVLMLSPIGKPANDERMLYLSQTYGPAKMERIRSKPNGRGLSHLPRVVQATSNGPAFDAYLLDVSEIDGKERIRRLQEVIAEVKAGGEPRRVTIKAKYKNVTETTIPMYSFPWGSHDGTVLVLFSKQDANVTVNVSYGR